jgi:hypothetical protein
MKIHHPTRQSPSLARARSGATLAHASAEVDDMRYIVAWMLGVPFSVIAVWYVLGHAACGR